MSYCSQNSEAKNENKVILSNVKDWMLGLFQGYWSQCSSTLQNTDDLTTT